MKFKSSFFDQSSLLARPDNVETPGAAVCRPDVMRYPPAFMSNFNGG
jgi:hypothetical protein